MKPELVVFDLDGVLVEPESSWVFVHEHYGTNNEDSLEAYNRGEIDDYEFMRRDVALWRSKKHPLMYSDILAILESVPIMPGARELGHKLKSEGVKTAIISGGLLPLAERIAKTAGIEHVLANDLLCDDIGEVLGEGKLQVALRDKRTIFLGLIKRQGVSQEHTVAVGNSYIDAQMLELAGLGIAFNPADDVVVRAADVVIKEKNLLRILDFLDL